MERERDMNIKQASEMLSQIEKSGLQTKTKVAQELVKELKLYIKSAGMKKQADLRWVTRDQDAFRKLFFGWASAALSKMNVGYEVPTTGGDTSPMQYGTMIVNNLPGRRGRVPTLNEEQVDALPPAQKYAYFLNGLFEELKEEIVEGINIAYKMMLKSNSKYIKSEFVDADDLWQVASTWASTGADVRTVTEGSRRLSFFPLGKIQENAESGADIAKQVSKAITEGVFKIMGGKNRFLSHEQRQKLGITKVTDEAGNVIKLRQENIEGVSEGQTYSRLDQFSAQGFIQNTLGQSDVQKYLDENQMSEEELEELTGMLTDGSVDNEPLERAGILEILVRSDHISKDDAFIKTLKIDFMNGEFSSTEAMEKAMEVLELTGNPITVELVELLQSYASGELDEDAFEDLEGNLIADGWLEDNIEISLESEEAVKMIQEKAQQMAEIAVSAINLPSGELGEAIGDLAKKDLEIKELKKLLKLFTEDNFHWMLDANLYLDDIEWAKALRESDPIALKAIQKAIEDHQEPLLPLGLKSVLNSNVFEDKNKIIAIKEFVDQCMPEAVVKGMFGGTKGPLAWYIELAIARNGGSFTIKANGSDVKLKIDKVKFFDLTRPLYATLIEATPMMTDTEFNNAVSAIEALIAPYRPKALHSPVNKWLLTIQNNAKSDKSLAKRIKDAYNQTRNSKLMHLKKFYSVIASYLVRYRFYLDLGLTEGDDLPIGLGKADCDQRVLSLIGPIPTSAVNEVKSEGYDTMLKAWRNETALAAQKRVELMITEKNKLNKQVKDVFKAFEIEEGSELYQAFVDLG